MNRCLFEKRSEKLAAARTRRAQKQKTQHTKSKQHKLVSRPNLRNLKRKQSAQSTQNQSARSKRNKSAQSTLTKPVSLQNKAMKKLPVTLNLTGSKISRVTRQKTYFLN